MPGFKRITDLPIAGAIDGNELVEVSQPSSTIRISATTISAAASDNSFNDSGSGFVTAGFQPGDRVRVTGFSTVGNNVVAGVVTSVAAGKIVIGGPVVIADEVAGVAVTIAKWTSRRIDLNEAVANTAAVQANTAKQGNATHTGDVTGATVLTIANSAVSNAKMANMAEGTLKGRLLGTAGAPQDLTGTQATALLDQFTTLLKGLVPPPGTPTGAFLRDDGTWAVPSGGGGGGSYTHPNHTGDVTSVGDGATTIAANAVTNSKLADMPTATIKGRSTAGTGDPEDLSVAQATALLDVFVGSGASHKKGLVPTPGASAGTTKYLREDGTWQVPPGSGGTPTESMTIALSDLTSALTTGTAKETIRMPYGFTLTAVRAHLATAQASGSILTVDINEGGVSILSTKLTIDNGEKTSTTAATAAVISDAILADDAEITFDIDQVGAGGAGLKVVLIGYRT